MEGPGRTTRRSERLRQKAVRQPVSRSNVQKSELEERALPAIKTTAGERRREVSSPQPDHLSLDIGHTGIDLPSEGRYRTSDYQDASIQNCRANQTPQDSRGVEGTPVSCWVDTSEWPVHLFKPDFGMPLPWPLLKTSPPASSSGEGPTHTPSDEKPRENKDAPYRSRVYELLLAEKSSYMDEAEAGISTSSQELCRKLLTTPQPTPKSSLFDIGKFEQTIAKLRTKNEARIIRDIAPLIAPSAETLAIEGAADLKHLIETVNEGWNNAIPACGPRPQPDYSLGFEISAFTPDQQRKLRLLAGGFHCMSHFTATCQSYLPFFTAEAKSATGGLEIADRQNAHSMTIAVRGVIELFRGVNREQELNGEILGFSISFDYRNVRIYGHYPLVQGEMTSVYRHLIDEFVLTSAQRWTAYQFARNVYSLWMPEHLKRIQSALDDLPENIELKTSGKLPARATGSTVAESEAAI